MSKLSSKLLRDDPAGYYTQLGAEIERKRILEELTQLTDRFNRGESDANMVMYLYRFIEARSKDTEKLDLQSD